MRFAHGFILALLAGLSGGGAALAANPGDEPAWPCVQRKVPSLTPAAIWTGPMLDGAGNWHQDPEVEELVVRLSQRRLPDEEAVAEVDAFAAGLGPDEQDRLTLLFAGLFETMNAERSEIIAGIERYGLRQTEIAATVRKMASDLEAMRRAPDADPQAVEEAQNALIWQTRIFNERRASLSYICEVPRLVERRLFTLGRAVSKALQ